MSEEKVSESGKTVAGGEPVNMTVEHAQLWAEGLQESEFRGLGDTREAARYRASRRSGVPETWFKRLRYRAHELSDVPASIYLKLKASYDECCERVEAAADHETRLRKAIENGCENDAGNLAVDDRESASSQGRTGTRIRP